MLASARLSMLGFTRNPELVDHADMARIFGSASSPGQGARLIVETEDPRLYDPVLQRLIADTEPMVSADRCWPDDEAPTQPYATCDTLPPPDDPNDDDDPDDVLAEAAGRG